MSRELSREEYVRLAEQYVGGMNETAKSRGEEWFLIKYNGIIQGAFSKNISDLNGTILLQLTRARPILIQEGYIQAILNTGARLLEIDNGLSLEGRVSFLACKEDNNRLRNLTHEEYAYLNN